MESEKRLPFPRHQSAVMVTGLGIRVGSHSSPFTHLKILPKKGREHMIWRADKPSVIYEIQVALL